jgi:hypothetical protein
MAKHWPNLSIVQVKDAAHAQQVLDYCSTTFGDFSYQHWTFSYSAPMLKIYFSELAMKTQFDLSWE